MADARSRLVAAWDLTVEGAPVETFAGTVLFVRRAGEPAVLKLFGPNSDEQRAADVLAHYGGHGAVRLLARDDAGILVERATPGTELVSLVTGGEDDRATHVVADTIAALHREADIVPGLRTVEQLGESFARHRRSGGDPRLAASLVERAERLYFALCASQGPRRVIHGDLHHYNILRDAERGWLAIDPKGVVGEAAYEVGASLRNPIEDARLFADPAIIARRVAILSERLGFDRDRMIAWVFAQVVLATIWSLEDGTDPSLGIAMAEAALPLLE